MTIAAFYGRVSTDSFDTSEDVKSVAGQRSIADVFAAARGWGQETKRLSPVPGLLHSLRSFRSSCRTGSWSAESHVRILRVHPTNGKLKKARGVERQWFPFLVLRARRLGISLRRTTSSNAPTILPPARSGTGSRRA
jgi:hypothetical protein